MADISTAVYGGMFDSTTVVETVGGFPRGDKAVDSAFFAKMIESFYRDGVLGDGFRVTAGGGMNITVGAGVAWIRGYMAWQKSDTTLTLTAGTWKILLRLNTAAGEFTLNATEGGAVNTETMRDLVLAEVTVPANAGGITDAMIADTRTDREKCGIVTSTVDALETVEHAQNANMLGGVSADGFLRRSGGSMTGALTAAPDATGRQTVRNIGYGTTLPDTLADGELFILLA
ncbi:MAG: hypothetical protein IJX93_02545 [Clostridia bacterium]|nr:hypothetical protein [Clostridia bacterium]MBQ8332637.1 hypothetical protein [Clostridia bacterium]MBQ8371045.1 hypothetical protein [Clostridia bacterium]MBQ8512850.1 hypothetical protein [Clostridia bacterium]